MNSARFIYDPGYDISILGLEHFHPFDSRKYSRAWGLLLERFGEAALRKVTRAPRGEVSEVDILAHHLPEQIDWVRSSRNIARALELWPLRFLPNGLLQRSVLRPMRLATQGTVEATTEAFNGGFCFNLGGGYHHAHIFAGEGFCIYADVPIAIKVAIREGRLKPGDRVLIVDLDAHRGNGWEYGNHIVDGPLMFFDMYSFPNYPGDGDVVRDNYDYLIHVPLGANDDEYFSILEPAFPRYLEAYGDAKLAFYNAGTDILAGDKVGRLGVSYDGILKRDRYVIEALRKTGIPTVMVTSGGYTADSHRLIADTASWILETMDHLPRIDQSANRPS